MFLLVVVAGRLLDGFVSGLAHRVHQRDPVASCLRHEARPQSVGAELRRVQPCHPAALLENEVDRLRGQCVGSDGAVLANLPEDRPGGDFGGLHPLKEGNSCTTRSKHEGTLPCRGGFRPAEGNANTRRR